MGAARVVRCSIWMLALRSAAQAVLSSELQLSRLPGGGVAEATAELSARVLRRLHRTPRRTRTTPRHIVRLLLQCVKKQAAARPGRTHTDEGRELLVCARAVLRCALKQSPSDCRLQACVLAVEMCRSTVGWEVAHVLRAAHDAMHTDRLRVGSNWRRRCEAALGAVEGSAHGVTSAVAQLLATSARAAWEGYHAGVRAHRFSHARKKTHADADCQIVSITLL